MANSVLINVARDFSVTPGARYRSDGDHSGQEFRETFLEQHFEESTCKDRITIVLDGTSGFATSFLEETFGGLARKFGKDTCLKRLEFVSDEDSLLPDEIISYIERCDE